MSAIDEVRAASSVFYAALNRMANGDAGSLADQLIQVAGDAACEIGVERGRFKMAGHEVSIEQRVTNVYRREAGGWKMIHHHADPSPAMLDVLASL